MTYTRRGYGAHLGRSASLTKERPRGTLSVSERQRAAFLLRETGWSYPALARRYGVSVGTVTQWISRVREAIEDARNIAGASDD